MMSDPHWIRRAFEAAQQTQDPKPGSAVGAVICSRLGDIELGASANRVPCALISVLPLDEHDPMRYHFIEHAERAAIIEAYDFGEECTDAQMFCTRFPCSDCARMVIAVGITRLVCPVPDEREGRWSDSQRAAQLMFDTANVKVDYISGTAPE